MLDEEYDVVVVGSGAAGMSAALTAAKQGLRTVIIEKAAHYGGSTARSGGGVWIPNNEALRRSGVCWRTKVSTAGPCSSSASRRAAGTSSPATCFR